ncbi:glycine/D-amino acid oxidase-like deaminating enzyme [Paraburkholderia sp. BL18I3N2]|uniref:NAD(P)/FAD-dependent oxidoreductase n=1 Tax=Paraburkholderia sp. BL18I3N2 TaxID=1938799 RepID=UPI000D04F87E|nr:FAD-binding oxidoreductase [Paraburkholderia sp. BL18I3N2]PRX32856.1 glycine/D-amino acid oxidase-like deaminating enzyme [Paraburkholderia sp. BL18I3N2]
MRVPLTRIDTTPTLPDSADVVVIGAGIVGVFTAWFLAKRGVKVALIEKGMVGGEQSSRNWGWCRQQNRDARELPIATESLRLWQQFEDESGESAGFRRSGLLYLSNDDDELGGWTRWCDFARTAGVKTEVLGSKQANERAAATGRTWKGGVFAPTDGTADPANAAPAVARSIIKLGGTVHQNCAARGIETEGGRVSGVVTEHGVIRTKTAVLSGGAWASTFCRQLGIRLPQATIRSSVMSVSLPRGTLPDALHTKNITITRRGDDAYSLAISGLGKFDPTLQKFRYAKDFLPMFARRWQSLSAGGLEGVRSGHEGMTRWPLDQPTPMEKMRVLDPSVDEATLTEIRRRAIDLCPVIGEGRVAASWAGYIDMTPDGIPAIGETQSLPGFVLAAGLSGHGFGIGPGCGHLVADMVTGETPIVDPEPYRPERFDRSVWGKVADF